MKHPKWFDLGIVFALALLAVLTLAMLTPPERDPAPKCYADTHLDYYLNCMKGRK